MHFKTGAKNELYITPLVLLLLLIFTSSSRAQDQVDDQVGPAASTDIVINEVYYTDSASSDWVQLRNKGVTIIDVSQWWICARTTCRQIGTLSARLGGSYTLHSDSRVTFYTGFDLNNTSSDLAVFSSADYDNPSVLIDFVQWGTSADVGSADVALAKGIWSTLPSGLSEQATSYDFVSGARSGQSMIYRGSNSGGGLLTLSSDFVNGSPTALELIGVSTSELPAIPLGPVLGGILLAGLIALALVVRPVLQDSRRRY